jgi:hypothetical protein
MDMADAPEASNPPNPPKLKRKRNAITDLERRNLRRRYASHPCTQEQLATWFESQPTGRKITQGQISFALSSQFAHLDSNNQKPGKLGAKRHYKGDWPELEGALYEWQQRMQHKKATITGEILKAKAHDIWILLPQYRDIEEPKWSNGWLGGFKTRFKIKEYIQHGEAAAADINNPENITQMADVRTLCKEYADKDIFNMDETGLFWKMSPDRTLATEVQSGGKKSKDRITLAFTTNADGSEKLDTWAIGKSKKPRCFKHINLKNLRVQYRNNKSKWMTGLIMEEYLRWLNKKMRGRKILLLLDNFSGHELGVELVGGKQGLENVRIEWLPPNTTSYWQPLDQGIIASFKLRYRKQWVLYMLQQLEAGKNPNKTVNLLKAIQWSRRAWEGLEPANIQKCFWKSTIIPPKEKNKNIENEATSNLSTAEIEELQVCVAALPGDHMPINDFINPAGEVIADQDEDILESIVERYSGNVEGEELADEAEDGIEEEIGDKVLAPEAIRALEVLQAYVLQKDTDYSILQRAMDGLSMDITREGIRSKKQVAIDSIFKRK